MLKVGVNRAYCAHGIADKHVWYLLCVQRFYKKAAAFVLRAVAKHSPELAKVSRPSSHAYAANTSHTQLDPDASIWCCSLWWTRVRWMRWCRAWRSSTPPSRRPRAGPSATSHSTTQVRTTARQASDPSTEDPRLLKKGRGGGGGSQGGGPYVGRGGGRERFCHSLDPMWGARPLNVGFVW